MINKEKLEKYFNDRNVNSIYKILPLYEESNESLESYISSLLIELNGLEDCIDNEYHEFITLIAVLSGIKKEVLKSDNKLIIKREVFKAIEISKLLAIKVVD